MDDQYLVGLCKNGDSQAFNELVRKYYQPLFGFFFKHLHETGACEDLTHDVVVKMIENIEKYRPFPGAKFSTWLFTIAYRTYLDYLKRASNHLTGSGSEYLEQNGEVVFERDPCEETIKKLDQEMLRRKLDELSPEMKSLLILRYFYDLPYTEIGKIMGLPPGEVKWKLHNALAKLRALIDSPKRGGKS